MMPATSPSKQGPIFVVGSGRSGTSLIRRLLNTHPDIYVAQETGFFISSIAMGRKKDSTENLQRFLGSYHAKWLRLDDQAVQARHRANGGNLRDTYLYILQSLAARTGARRFGDKIPGAELALRRLLTAWPDARIIHIARHPVAVATSKRGVPFTSGSLVLIAASLRITAKRLAGFSDERVMFIRIEDLLADIPGTYRRILEHIGAPPDPRGSPDPSKLPVRDTTAFEKPYPWLASANEPIRPGGANPRETLSPAAVRLVERIARPYMALFAYQPSALEAEPSRLARLGVVLGDLPILMSFIGRAIYRLLLLRLRWRQLSPAQEQELGLSLNPRLSSSDPQRHLPRPPG